MRSWGPLTHNSTVLRSLNLPNIYNLPFSLAEAELGYTDADVKFIHFLGVWKEGIYNAYLMRTVKKPKWR